MSENRSSKLSIFGIHRSESPLRDALAFSSGYDLSFFFEIVHAAGRLHNLCINWNTPLEAAICDSARVDDLGRLIAPEWQLESGFDSVINHQTGSTLREHLVQMLQNTPSLHVIRSHHQ